MDKQTRKMFQDWLKIGGKTPKPGKEAMSYERHNHIQNIWGDQGVYAWKNWLVAQKEIFSYCKENITLFQTNFNPLDIFYDRNKLNFEKTGQFYQEWLKTSANNFSDVLNWVPARRDTMQIMIQASEVYSKLHAFWNDLAMSPPFDNSPDKMKEIYRYYVHNYNKILDSFFTVIFSGSVKELIKSPAKIARIYDQTFYNFFQPWHEASSALKLKYSLALKGDREAYKDFLRLWYKAYRDTYGEVLRMPAVETNLQIFEKLQKNINDYIQYMVIVNEFSNNLYKVGYEVMENLMKNLWHIGGEGKAPVIFNEFYKLWWKSNEDAYLSLFQSDGFNAKIKEVLKLWSEFKNGYDDLMADLMGETGDRGTWARGMEGGGK